MFAEFNQKLKDIGYNGITPFQNKIVEAVYNDRNIVLSNKNEEHVILAIFLACLMKMDFKNNYAQCLFIIPESENVSKRISLLQSFIPYHNLKIGSIVESIPLKEQLKILQNDYQIIVGTPLRMKNLVDSELLNIGNALFTIVECVDEIAKLNLLADLDLLLYSLKTDCQKIFLSKNISEDIVNFLKKFEVDFSFIKQDIADNNILIEEKRKVHEAYTVLEAPLKYKFLKKILKRLEKNTIIFVKDLIKAKNLYLNLRKDGFSNIQVFNKDSISGGKSDILITDFLPEKPVDYIINYGLPGSLQDYKSKTKLAKKLMISLLDKEDSQKAVYTQITQESRFLSPKQK